MFSFSFKKKINFIYLFIFGHVGSSLLCRFSLVVVSRDYSLAAVCGFLLEVASLVPKHGL